MTILNTGTATHTNFAATRDNIANHFKQNSPTPPKVNQQQTHIAKYADTRKNPVVIPVPVEAPKKAEAEVVEEKANFAKNLAAIAKQHQSQTPAPKTVPSPVKPTGAAKAQPANKNVDSPKIDMKAKQAELAKLLKPKFEKQTQQTVVSKEKIEKMGQSPKTGFLRSMWTKTSQFLSRVLNAVNIFKYFRKKPETAAIAAKSDTTTTAPVSATPPPPPPPLPTLPKK